MSSDQGTARTGDYVDAGGVRTYFEVYGEGDPLVLLHGGLCPAETWDPQIPTLSQSYRVYVPERRGHGRTPDVVGPFTFEAMANDTLAFMEAVGIGSAHLVGWSDGALIGLLAAIRSPEHVRKLVYISQNLNPEGIRPEARPILEGMSRETVPPMFEQMYAAVSPDGPEHFGIVLDKLIEMWHKDQGLRLEELAGVLAPTLVLVGDDDIVSIEHAASLYRAIPDAQLGVVPGTSHPLAMEKPEIVNRLVLDFLADEQIPRMMPVTGAFAESEH